MAGMSWNLIGHSWAEQILRQQISADSLRHAYLFSGPSGVGRRTLALRFAQAINCPQSSSTGEPCGTCRVCRQIEDMQQADLNILQAEQEGDTLKVDQVRDLQHLLSLAPYESRYRIALLMRFEEANLSAQNALLKTLEEPNPHVILIITTNDPDNLLPTVVSRCEHLNLRPLAVDVLSAHLQESHHIDLEKAVLISHITGGRPGYALRLINEEDLLLNRKQYLDQCLQLINSSPLERMLFVEKLIKSKERKDIKICIREGLGHWLLFWRDILISNTKSSANLTNLDFQDNIHRIASKVESESTAQIIASLDHAFIRLNTANLQTMLDNLLLAWPIVE